MSLKYDKLQTFTVFNYFPEDGYSYSAPFSIYPRNGLKNNFGYTTKDMNNSRFIVKARAAY
jgi:hypothetical protein